jgi:hypothetical protein
LWIGSHCVHGIGQTCRTHGAKKNTPWPLVWVRNISTERPPLIGEVSDNFWGQCCVVSTTDPYGCIIWFLDRSRYYFFQVAPQLYSRGWVDPVPDPPLLRKSGSAGNGTRDLWIHSQELWPLDHRSGTYGIKKKSYSIGTDSSHGTWPLGRLTRHWKDNIKDRTELEQWRPLATLAGVSRQWLQTFGEAWTSGWHLVNGVSALHAVSSDIW